MDTSTVVPAACNLLYSALNIDKFDLLRSESRFLMHVFLS